MGFCLKVLVTGCAGFIGSRVSALLSAVWHEVVGIDNLNDAYDVRMKQLRVDNLLAHNAVEWVNSDITNNQSVRSLIFKVKPDAVINLAARAGVRQSIDNPWVYYETNVIGTLNLLEACKEFGVRRFLLASTSSVYGNNSIPFSEDAYIEDLFLRTLLLKNRQKICVSCIGVCLILIRPYFDFSPFMVHQVDRI